MFGLGLGEVIVILIVALLVLGPDKLPDAARQIGKTIRELRKHTDNLKETIEQDEHIGGTMRELKSALRGDPLRPQTVLKPAIGAVAQNAEKAPEPDKVVVAVTEPVVAVAMTAPVEAKPADKADVKPPGEGGGEPAMDERRLPFMGHLSELRTRLRNAIIALLVGICLTWYWSETLYALLARPLVNAWRMALPGSSPLLKFGSLTEPFWVYFELSLYAGIFVASPVIFHQLWKFIAPGLYDKEKKIALPFAICSAIMFIGGALFCYFFVLPAAFKFFLSYSNENVGKIRDALGIVNANVTGTPLGVEPALFMQQYLDLTTKFLLGFGLVFELPMLIFFLSYVGIVDHRKLWRFNRYWIILSFVIGGILTPGPDVVSQFLMAMPLLILYNLSILVSYIVTKRREDAARAAG